MNNDLFQLSLKDLNQRHQTCYKVIQNEFDLQELSTELSSSLRIAVDLETTGLNLFKDRVVGISFCSKNNAAAYIPIGHITDDQQLPIETTLHHIKQILEDKQKTLIFHNAKFDLQFLLNLGIDASEAVIFDSMIAAVLLNYEKCGLKWLSEHVLGESQIKYEEVSDDNEITLDQVAVETVGFYACMDADYTFRLAQRFENELAQRQLNPLFTVEMEVLKALVFMERAGVRTDVEFLKQLEPEYLKNIAALQERIWEYTGKFNVNSNTQMMIKLFDEMKFPKIRATKKGFSVDAGVLTELKRRTQHPVFDVLLEYRSVEKMYGTYIKGLQREVDERSRTHTNYWQCGAGTGRMSSSNPNLQNIPEEARRAMVAEEGCCFLSLDYSQIELRVLAHLSSDPELVRSFQQGLDVHRHTASQIYSVNYESVTDEMRKVAKTLNFGLVYGISPYGIAVGLKISEKEALDFMIRYFERYPGVKVYIARMKAFAREHGYVETILKRRVLTPEIKNPDQRRRGHAERAAINAPVQGSAADIIKIAMARIHQVYKRTSVTMIMQVHDELIFEIPQSCSIQQIAIDIKQIMEIPPMEDFKIPLAVDTEVGPSYGELQTLN